MSVCVCKTNQSGVTQFSEGKCASAFPFLSVDTGTNLPQSSDGISCVLIFSRQYVSDMDRTTSNPVSAGLTVPSATSRVNISPGIYMEDIRDQEFSLVYLYKQQLQEKHCCLK